MMRGLGSKQCRLALWKLQPGQTFPEQSFGKRSLSAVIQVTTEVSRWGWTCREVQGWNPRIWWLDGWIWKEGMNFRYTSRTVKLPDLPNPHQDREATKVAKRTVMEREGKGSRQVLWMILKDQTTVISSEQALPPLLHLTLMGFEGMTTKHHNSRPTSALWSE